jgi:hypothetical protein
MKMSRKIVQSNDTPHGEAATWDELAHAVVLVVEGFVTEAQFSALTGQTLEEINGLLADPKTLARVQRLSLQLRNSGALARLEAAKHARPAVQIAAAILQNEDIHPGQRLAAAEQIHRIAGTSRPSAEKDQAERIRINIFLGEDGDKERSKVVIEGEATDTLMEQIHG